MASGCPLPPIAADPPTSTQLPTSLLHRRSIDQPATSLPSPVSPRPTRSPTAPPPCLPPPPPPAGTQRRSRPASVIVVPEACAAVPCQPATPAPTKRVRFAITPPLHCISAAPRASGSRPTFTAAPLSATPASCGRPDHVAVDALDGWTTVRRKRSHGAREHSRRPTTRPSLPSNSARDKLLVSLSGKCFRCLGRGHRASSCRDPLRCFGCGGPGHKARLCPKAKTSQNATAPQPPPRLHSDDFPPLVQATMPRPGEPGTRPSETFAVAASTGDMEAELERLSTHAVVAWLGRDRPEVSADRMKRAFCHQFCVRPDDISVARHHPADFVVTFSHQHHRETALERREFLSGNLDIRVRRWLPMTQADPVDLRYHVRLCLEGIPLHAWNESIDKRVVARACDLDYVELQSLRKEDTRALCLWAWTEDPSRIPKVTWLTISRRSSLVRDGATPPARRSGSHFRVIVHLDLVEDPPESDGRCSTREFRWALGVVDGERTPRDRHDPAPVAIVGRRDEDDDDEERRGRRSRKEDSWSSRLFRSLSRAPHRERDRSEPRRDRHGDRRSTTGGRRHLTCSVDDSLLQQNGSKHVSLDVFPDRVAPRQPVCIDGSATSGGGRELRHRQVRGRRQSMSPSPRPRQDAYPNSGRATAARGRSRERMPRRRPGRRARSVPRRQHGTGLDSTAEGSRCTSDARRDDLDSTHPPPPSPPAIGTTMPAGSTTPVRRFRPGCVYRRRSRSAPRQELQAATSFIDSISAPVAQPILRPQDQGYELPKKTQKSFKGSVGTSTRRSARLATISWPRGDIQSRARQVLMKRLGILPESDSDQMQNRATDEELKRYFSLFNGPLTLPATKALVALCGLDDPNEAGLQSS
jgi:hypothetical protein